MALSKAERWAKIHAEALEEFDRIQSAQTDERKQALEDRRFYSITGAQWEGQFGEQFDSRPRLEFNRVHLAVIRIFNEYRNNRVTVDFQPRDGEPDDLADTCDGLYRADEKSSTADEAYDNAFEEGVGGGIGAWRLRACYEDEDDDENDRQRVRIEPIFDADSCVFFDLDAKRYDKADAKRCFVLTGMTRDGYADEYNDDPATWPKGISATEFDWAPADVVYVAEYYRVEMVPETILIFQGLDGQEMRVPQSELEEDQQKADELLAFGFKLLREKTVKRQKVHKYILSGGSILEDCGYIAGRMIPIIPYYGKRWVVDGVERFMGHVRLAKDAQRLSNSLMSWLADIAGRFDVEKPIFTPDQIAGHAQMWAKDNVTRYPYLLVNPVTDATTGATTIGPASYTKAPTVPPAMAALTQLAEGALKELLGNQEAGEQMQSNISGKVVELVQNRLDMQVYIYMSNLAKSMKRSGEVWLSMMKDIAVEEGRKMKTVEMDGKVSAVELNKPAYDVKTGEYYRANDLSSASFEVDVDVGPSSSSRRASTVRALTGIASITDDPQMKQALLLATMQNVEGEGLQDLRDWARKRGIGMGIVKPTEEEAQEMAQQQANQQPDPQAQALQAMAEEAQANAAEARAATVQKIADADLKRAQTNKTIAETHGEGVKQAINVAETFQRAAAPPAPGKAG